MQAKGSCACARVPDVTLRTDATLLRRIIDNLVSNAIRFSRSGGILVALRLRRDHVLLQVWDQGSGIAATNLPLIFDEFYQVKRSDVAQGGMGLGLAIVARSVRLLGGDISVRSRLGSGTCFTLSCLAPHCQGATVRHRPWCQRIMIAGWCWCLMMTR